MSSRTVIRSVRKSSVNSCSEVPSSERSWTVSVVAMAASESEFENDRSRTIVRVVRTEWKSHEARCFGVRSLVSRRRLGGSGRGDDEIERRSWAHPAEVVLLGLVPERVPTDHEDWPFAGDQALPAGGIV